MRKLTVNIFLIVFLVANAFAAKAKQLQQLQNYTLPLKNAKMPEAPKTYQSNKFEIKNKKISISQPSVNYQQYYFAKEAFLSEKRDEAIKLLRQQLDSGYQKNKDNILLRLGQLYAEKYMELSYRENELYNKQLKEFEKEYQKDKKIKPPTLQSSRSQSYLKDALKIFYQLEKQYSNHEKIDEVLFFIGFVEMESAHPDKGAKYLEKVVSKYPKSLKYEEAAIALADYYFEKHQFKKSYDKYLLISKRKSSSLHDYAEYKLAWCELNIDKKNAAIQRMKTLVAKLEGETAQAKFNLREQAIKDLIIFYGEVGRVNEAMQYFTKIIGRDKAYENLKLLADILKTKGFDTEALAAYQMLLEEYPNTTEAPKYKLGVFETQSRLGKSQLALDTLIEALEKYSKDETVKSESERIALFYHQSAQKSSNKQYYQYALKLYDEILKQYPDHVNKKKLTFYKGEIYFNQKKWLEAANSYLEVAKIDPKDKLSDEAVYNALLALDSITVKKETLDRISKDPQASLEKQDIPESESKFLNLAETYIKDYPQGSKLVDVKFRMAAIYYRYKHFDNAIVLFKEIAEKYPKHRTAVTAASLTLDIYSVQKNYILLEKEANHFLGIKDLGDERFRAEIAEIKNELGFKNIEQFEKNNEWAQAGETYFNFYKNNAKSPLAEKAIYNAYICYEKANDKEKVKEIGKIFLNKFPNHALTGKIILTSAKLAEEDYDFVNAQKYYEEYAIKFPKEKDGKKALYNAAVFAEVLEQNKKAVKLYEDYEKVKSAEESRAILVSLSKLYRKLNDYENLEKTYKKLVSTAKSNAEKASVLAEYLNILEKAGRKQDQVKINDQIIYFSQNIKDNAKLGLASYYLAKYKFDATKKLKDKYLEVSLRLPPEDLVYLLKRKQKLLTQLISAYDNVIDYGVPEFGVAALNQKSEAYKNFIDSYRKVTVPKKYQGKEKEELEAQLKTLDTQIIKPFEEKVSDTLNTCVSRASEFLVVSEDSKNCRKRLGNTFTNQPLPTAKTEYLSAPKEEKRLYVATEALKQNKKELAKFLYGIEEKNNTKYQYLIDYNLGLLALHEKNKNLYVDYLEKSYKQSQSPDVDNQLGVLYLQAENFSKAEEIFKASIAKKNTEVGMHGLAASLMGSGKKSEADSVYEKCRREYPDYAPCNQRKREGT